MKFTRIYLFILLVIIVVCTNVVNSEEEYVQKRQGILQRRNVGRPSALQKSASTTSTTTTQPLENDDEVYDEQEEHSDDKLYHRDEPAITTTTEAPKKFTLTVRPFRSNDELLNALKKRRQQSKTQRTVSERPIAREEEQGEEVEISKPQPRTKNVKNLPATKKRTFNAPKSKVAPKEQPKPEVIDEPTPSASSPLSERIGRSRLNFSPRSIRQ